MKIFKLIRCMKSSRGTFGVLLGHDDLLICNTVEKDWNENKVNISCVPEGFYKCHRMVRHFGTSKAYVVFVLKDVPGRTLIQIHKANKPSELKGCIAPVTSWHKFEFEMGGKSSGVAFYKFMAACEGEDRIGLWIKDTCWVNDFPPRIINVGE